MFEFSVITETYDISEIEHPLNIIQFGRFLSGNTMLGPGSARFDTDQKFVVSVGFLDGCQRGLALGQIEIRESVLFFTAVTASALQQSPC